MATASLFIQTLAGKIGMGLAQEFSSLLASPGTMSDQLFKALEAYVGRSGALNVQNFITSRSNTISEKTEEGLTQMCGREWAITCAGQA